MKNLNLVTGGLLVLASALGFYNYFVGQDFLTLMSALFFTIASIAFFFNLTKKG